MQSEITAWACAQGFQLEAAESRLLQTNQRQMEEAMRMRRDSFYSSCVEMRPWSCVLHCQLLGVFEFFDLVARK
jgi:hypothetical protein